MDTALQSIEQLLKKLSLEAFDTNVKVYFHVF